jgi:CheY-like chemotaxis protein
MAKLTQIIKGSVAKKCTAAWVTAALNIDASRPRVLIASSNLIVAERLTELLRENDHHIMIATDRPLTLRLAVWELPDVLILNAQLAGDDSIALCASLKHDHRTCSITIIIAANTYDHQQHRRCLEAGADDYLAWSDPVLIQEQISSLLRAKQNLEEAWIERIACAFSCGEKVSDNDPWARSATSLGCTTDHSKAKRPFVGGSIALL